MSARNKKKFDFKIFILIALPVSILLAILILPELNVKSDLQKNIIEPHFDTFIEGEYEIENVAENMHPVEGVTGDIYDVFYIQGNSRGAYQLIIEDGEVVSTSMKEGYYMSE